MNKNKNSTNKKQSDDDKTKKHADEMSLNNVLETLGAEASTYKHAGMTHISSLLAEAS